MKYSEILKEREKCQTLNYFLLPPTVSQITVTHIKPVSSLALQCSPLPALERPASSGSSSCFLQGVPPAAVLELTVRGEPWHSAHSPALHWEVALKQTNKLCCLMLRLLSLLRICDPFAKDEMTRALKIVDFSHSLDLRVQSRVGLSHSFPISQTPHGQQLLVKSSLPYQVSLCLAGQLSFHVSFAKIYIFLSFIFCKLCGKL